jgi:hypothetical protein
MYNVFMCVANNISKTKVSVRSVGLSVCRYHFTHLEATAAAEGTAGTELVPRCAHRNRTRVKAPPRGGTLLWLNVVTSTYCVSTF